MLPALVFLNADIKKIKKNKGKTSKKNKAKKKNKNKQNKNKPMNDPDIVPGDSGPGDSGPGDSNDVERDLTPGGSMNNKQDEDWIEKQIEKHIEKHLTKHLEKQIEKHLAKQMEKQQKEAFNAMFNEIFSRLVPIVENMNKEIGANNAEIRNKLKSDFEAFESHINSNYITMLDNRSEAITAAVKQKITELADNCNKSIEQKFEELDSKLDRLVEEKYYNHCDRLLENKNSTPHNPSRLIPNILPPSRLIPNKLPPNASPLLPVVTKH